MQAPTGNDPTVSFQSQTNGQQVGSGCSCAAQCLLWPGTAFQPAIPMVAVSTDQDATPYQ